MKELIYDIIFWLVWMWVWGNETYRRAYWLYVTQQDWYWMHIMHDPKKEKK